MNNLDPVVRAGILRAQVKNALHGRSECHGYSHALHVERIALHIATSYPEIDHNELKVTALLHDVWDYKFVTVPVALVQSNFRGVLRDYGLTEDAIDRVYQNIELLSWSKGKTPLTLEGKIVQDADRITALGATGILRCATYSVTNKKTFDDVVQHLMDKCLLLKDSLNLPESKLIAEERHQLLVQFIESYHNEQFL